MKKSLLGIIALMLGGCVLAPAEDREIINNYYKAERNLAVADTKAVAASAVKLKADIEAMGAEREHAEAYKAYLELVESKE